MIARLFPRMHAATCTFSQRRLVAAACSSTNNVLLSSTFSRHCKPLRCFSTSNGNQPPLHRLGQPLNHSHPHLVRPNELTPGIAKAEYEARRRRLFARMPANSCLVIASNPECYQAHDIPYSPFRQDSNFFYLTGFQEPESYCILEKAGDAASGTFTLLVRERDADRELWLGARAGVEGARQAFGPTRVASSDPRTAFFELQEAHRRAKRFFVAPSMNSEAMSLIRAVLGGQTARASHLPRPPHNLIEELRVIKSPAELAIMRRAAQASGRAFSAVMASSRSLLASCSPARVNTEDSLAAVFEMSTRLQGAQRLAFPCVVAAGPNANTIHYLSRDSPVRPGQLVLMDAGCELDGYASDITRTFPANGKFSAAQRELYNALLDVQKQCIELCVADGSRSLASIQDEAAVLVSQALIDLGILRGTTAQTAAMTGAYNKYYPHNIGHYLGIDTHDTPASDPHAPLRPNMVVTIEPGLYIPDSPDIPREFRGCGLRIEDDVLIGQPGRTPEVLTKSAPKSVEEIEECCAGSFNMWSRDLGLNA